MLLQHDDYTSDLLHSQLPYRAFLGEQLRQGHLPTRFPDVYSGVPLWGQIESGVFYPPNLLYALLDPYLALDVSIVLTVLLGAVGTFLLARRLGAGGPGAALAGVAFALAGFNVAHLKHRNMHDAAAWLPWMMWAVESRLRDPRARWDAALAAFVALSVFAGHPQITFISLLAVVGRVAVGPGWQVLKGSAPLPDRIRAVVGPAIGCAGGLLAAGVALLPAARFTPESTRTGGLGFDYASAFPYWLPDLWTFLIPQRNGLYEAGTYYIDGGAPSWTLPWENYGFVGVLTLGLAVVAVAALARARPDVRAWGLAVVTAAVLMVGPATPVFRAVWTVVPGMKLFRFPQRFVLLADLGLAVLAGVGLAWLLSWLATRTSPTVVRATGVAVFAVVVLELVAAQSPRIPVDDADAWRRPGEVTSAIVDSGPGRVFVDQPYAFWRRAYERSKGFEEGFALYRMVGELPLANRSAMLGVDHVEGYTNVATLRTGAFWQRHSRDLIAKQLRPEERPDGGPFSPAFQGLLDRAAVRWVVAEGAMPSDAWRPVVEGPIPLWERRDPLPRAYVATAWQVAPDLDAAAEWMTGPGADLPTVPVIEGAPTSSGAGSIHPAPVEDDGPAQVVVSVDGLPEGWLILADSHAAGWTARVDGAEATILPANGWQRAVSVPAGARQVEFRYRPPGLAPGLGCSLLGLLVLAAWVASRGLGRVGAGAP